MGGYNQAAINATKIYQKKVHDIMNRFGISYKEAREHYAQNTKGKQRRTRRSSHKLLADRLLATKAFVRQCGSIQNALDSLKLYKEIS